MPLKKYSHFYTILSRKKSIEDSSESKLIKVLTSFDLTALGIGSTLGVGVYVLAGEVSKTKAGPAVVISFFIAAVASIFAALCYAEFGAKVPKAGSAYIYSYVTVGEFVAYLIGWNLILEYAIGSASVVKGLSTYLDSLCGYAMRNFLMEYAPLRIEGLSGYPDIFAFGVTMLFSWAIALGAKESTIVNNIFTFLNLSVVVFVILFGLSKVTIQNWNIPTERIPDGYGDGGFMPYGISGVVKGAAVCFYGFIGFDCIATASEEAINPRKSIPFAVIASLTTIFIAYFGISTVLTMMLPYFEQDENAPLPHVFQKFGWVVAEYIVNIGAMFGLCASLMGAMFPLPRIVFAMSSDGLLFQFMGEISAKYKTPFNGTLLTGFLTALLAAVFNLTQLVDIMSIGTLLSYSTVAICVILLRYKSEQKRVVTGERVLEQNVTMWRSIFNLNGLAEPNERSSKIVTRCTITYCILCFILSFKLAEFEENDENRTVDILQLVFASLLSCILLYIVSRQPTSCLKHAFKVPLVPWIPGISIFINIYLMTRLEYMTWIRLTVWLLIGLIIYFSYSLKHSNLNTPKKSKYLNKQDQEVAIYSTIISD